MVVVRHTFRYRVKHALVTAGGNPAYDEWTRLDSEEAQRALCDS
jgi:hypothetical protein